jgi:hypothetical protein
LASANNLPVLAATLTMPRIGLWSADLVVDTEDPTKLAGAIDLELGDVHFKGTVYRSAPFQGRTELRMVGGAGKLNTPLPARFYRETPVSVPLGDILAACGETLSTASEAATLTRGLDTWTRTGPGAGSSGTGGNGIQQLATSLGFAWRSLGDGTIWVGYETWPELKATGEALDEFPAEGRAVYAMDLAILRPGVTFRGRRISGVVHRLTGSSFRTEVLFEPDGSLWSRLRGAIDAFVRALLAPTVYYGMFPAQVISQGADGRLDLKPDDTRIPEMSGVPIRWGIPGFKAVVPAGTRVLIGFDGGDPRKRYAAVWDEGAITSVSFDGGVQAVARQGDLVQCGGVGTTVTFAGASPMVPGTPYLISFDAILPTALVAAPLYGAVSTGNQKLKA